MNRVSLIANLCRDPETRTTNNGVSVTTFTVAVQRRHGERKADFFNCVAWRGLADNVAKFTHKGSKVFVSGSLQNREYTTQDGQKRHVTEIIADECEFLDPREKHEEPLDEDIPF